LGSPLSYGDACLAQSPGALSYTISTISYMQTSAGKKKKKKEKEEKKKRRSPLG
jgi:hypothetical protein